MIHVIYRRCSKLVKIRVQNWNRPSGQVKLQILQVMGMLRKTNNDKSK